MTAEQVRDFARLSGLSGLSDGSKAGSSTRASSSSSSSRPADSPPVGSAPGPVDLDTDLDTDLDPDLDPPWHCVQRPGELFYVPRFWGHATVNARTTVGMAVEFDMGDC